jgi:molecular chaperone GrpE
MSEDIKQDKNNTVDVDFKNENESVDEQKESDEVSVEDQLTAEIAKLKDTLIRKVADSENLRKRLEREKSEAIKFSNTAIVKDILPTIDNFEHVIASMPKEGVDKNIQAVFDGILLCQKSLLSALQKHGITKIETKPGDEFDHQYHQAMCEVECKKIESGKIANVMQNGYLYNDRLLRPAMVSIAKN